MSLRNFVRLLFSAPRGGTTTPESLDSLLTTIKDAVHVRGADVGAVPVAGNSEIYKMIVKGHRNYTSSFRSKRSHS